MCGWPYSAVCFSNIGLVWLPRSGTLSLNMTSRSGFPSGKGLIFHPVSFGYIVSGLMLLIRRCDDHNILMQRLEVIFGLMNTALGWICSFLADQTQPVLYHGFLSLTWYILFEVPHGSVFGPLLYVLYTAKLEQIVTRRILLLHIMYADDCYVYSGCPSKMSLCQSASGHQCLAECADVAWTRRWHSCCGSAWVSCWIRSTAMTLWCSARVSPSQTLLARDLGVFVDGELLLVAHVMVDDRLSLRLQSPTQALTSSPLIVRECHQYTCLGIHLISVGLMQLWHQRWTTSWLWTNFYSRFHGHDIFREIGLLPWKMPNSVKSMIFHEF